MEGSTRRRGPRERGNARERKRARGLLIFFSPRASLSSYLPLQLMLPANLVPRSLFFSPKASDAFDYRQASSESNWHLSRWKDLPKTNNYSEQLRHGFFIVSKAMTSLMFHRKAETTRIPSFAPEPQD